MATTPTNIYDHKPFPRDAEDVPTLNLQVRKQERRRRPPKAPGSVRGPAGVLPGALLFLRVTGSGGPNTPLGSDPSWKSLNRAARTHRNPTFGQGQPELPGAASPGSELSPGTKESVAPAPGTRGSPPLGAGERGGGGGFRRWHLGVGANRGWDGDPPTSTPTPGRPRPRLAGWARGRRERGARGEATWAPLRHPGSSARGRAA